MFQVSSINLLERRDGIMKDVIDLIEGGKIKRYFRSRNKHSFKDAITHVTQHVSGTEHLFLEELDYLYMLHLMKKVCQRFKISLIIYPP